jgi:methylmalonyl-CoA carboxyltransferase 1.3S subunit
VKLKITIENKTYEVDVEVADETGPRAPHGYVLESARVRVPAAPAAAPQPTNGGSVNEDKVCRSPINGTVVRVVAQEGQNIQPGDILIVLEAMKMETNITAPEAGKIAAIKVNAGDSVKAEQVVVELE